MAYNIKTVAELTGIPRNTLLAWERRYGVVSPGREDNGYRLFSDEDIARLKRIKSLVDQGHRVSEAIRLVERDSLPAHAAPVDEPSQLDALRDRLLEALLNYDRTAADDLRRRLSLLPFESAIEEVYLPVMCEVGERWEAGTVSVAQEHFASAFVREQLVGMLQSLAAGPRTGRHVLCAGLEGEDHELGLLAVAVRLALRGWRVTYLGANLPVEELSALAWEQRPELICQSAVRERPTADLLAYGHALRQRCPPGTLVALGGASFGSLREKSSSGLLFAASFQDLVGALDSGPRRGR